MSTEAAFFGDIPRVPFIMPGTDQLAHAAGEASRQSSAQVILGCHAVGKTPPTLPADVVETLQPLGDLMA